MVEFCPECSNLLRKQTRDSKVFLVCRCGYEREIKTDTVEKQKKAQKKKEELDKKLIVVKEEDKISVHPLVTKICPKCGHNEAEAWQEQTRSADEPSTSFFRCVKCRYTWREY
ncbi:MAG: transcription factor S [Candidatus Lokiarchaeota archaeon]|nr:transcription factor S [Candidatus Lokiarchaeota archaeon]